MFGLNLFTPRTPSHLESNESMGTTLFDSASFNLDAANTCLGALGSHAKINQTAVKVLKFSGVFALFSGTILTINGWKELKLSGKLHDFWGKIRACSYLSTGGVQIAAGGAYAGMGATSIFYLITSSKVAIAAANIFQVAGGALLAGSSFVGGSIVLVELKLAVECKLKIKKLRDGGMGQNEILKEIKKQVLNAEEGLLWKKVLSSNTLQEIIGKSSADLLDKIQTQLNNRIKIFSFLGFLSILGAVVSVLSLATVPLASPWVLGIVNLVLGIAWVVLDTFAIMENVENAKISTWEKTLLYAMAFFTFATTATGTLLAKEFIFALGTALIGIILLLVQLFLIYKIQSV